MALVILHNLDDEEVLVNTAALNAAARKYPDKEAVINEPFTKLYYTAKDKGLESLGFPDSVKETPAEIFELAKKSAS
jgi:hypothetical protein